MNEELYWKMLKLLIINYSILNSDICGIPDEFVSTLETLGDNLRADIEGYEEFHTELSKQFLEWKKK